MEKECKTCKKVKMLSEFYEHAACKLGVRPECKECSAKRHSEYQKNNKEKYLKYQKKHYSENKELYKEYALEYRDIKNKARRLKYANDPDYREKLCKNAKLYHKQNPLAKKRQSLKKTYGMTLDDFSELLKTQNNSCAICGFKDNGNKKIFPFVDHCHITGKIRGLLCLNCNHALGKFKDSVLFLKNAIKYLEVNK